MLFRERQTYAVVPSGDRSMPHGYEGAFRRILANWTRQLDPPRPGEQAVRAYGRLIQRVLGGCCEDSRPVRRDGDSVHRAPDLPPVLAFRLLEGELLHNFPLVAVDDDEALVVLHAKPPATRRQYQVDGAT